MFKKKKFVYGIFIKLEKVSIKEIWEDKKSGQLL